MTTPQDALIGPNTSPWPAPPPLTEPGRLPEPGPLPEPGRDRAAPGAVFDPTRRVAEAPLWRLAGALLTVVAVAGAGMTWWQVAFRQERVTQQSVAGVTALEAHLGAGRVTIRGTDRPDVQLTRTLSWAGLPDSQPAPRESLSGGTLRLDNPCTGHISCSASYLVEAPHALAARIEQSSGDVAADGIARLTVVVSSGDVSATGVDEVDVRTTSGDIQTHRIGRARLQTASGRVSGTDLTGESAQIVTTSGDVELRAAAVGRLTVDTTSGDVSVQVAGPQPVDVRAQTRTGRTEVEVPAAPSATRTVTVTTTSGDITVEPAP